MLSGCSSSIEEDDLYKVWRYESIVIDDVDVTANFQKLNHISFRSHFGKYLFLPCNPPLMDKAQWEYKTRKNKNILEVTNSTNGIFDDSYEIILDKRNGVLTLSSSSILLILIDDSFSLTKPTSG